MNKIDRLIKQRETQGYVFKPTMSFFRQIKIGKKRFYMIVRGETDPTIPELKAIAEHFGVNFLDLIPEENATV